MRLYTSAQTWLSGMGFGGMGRCSVPSSAGSGGGEVVWEFVPETCSASDMVSTMRAPFTAAGCVEWLMEPFGVSEGEEEEEVSMVVLVVLAGGWAEVGEGTSLVMILLLMLE